MFHQPARDGGSRSRSERSAAIARPSKLLFLPDLCSHPPIHRFHPSVARWSLPLPPLDSLRGSCAARLSQASRVPSLRQMSPFSRNAESMRCCDNFIRSGREDTAHVCVYLCLRGEIRLFSAKEEEDEGLMAHVTKQH